MLKNLRILIGKIFTDNVAQVFLATFQILNVFSVSVYYFISNMPKEFGQQGAVAIILAVIALSIDKSRYEKSSKDWETLTLNEKIKLNERLSGLRDEALDRTFNLYASQIAQIAQMVNIRTGFNRTDEELQSLIETVENQQADAGEFREKEEAVWDEYKRKVGEFTKFKRTTDSWAGLFWKLEIAFVAIGTFQNAFGPDIVTSFHGV